MRTEAVTVDKARFAAAGVPLSGSLTAMMLDTSGRAASQANASPRTIVRMPRTS